MKITKTIEVEKCRVRWCTAAAEGCAGLCVAHNADWYGSETQRELAHLSAAMLTRYIEQVLDPAQLDPAVRS